MRLTARQVWSISVTLMATAVVGASQEGAFPVARTGLWEIVADQMRAGGSATGLGGGRETVTLCVTEAGRRIHVQFPQVGDILFEVEPTLEEQHVASSLPPAFQGVTWVLDVTSETELSSRIFGQGSGSALSQVHTWRFVEEAPGVQYCPQD